MNKHTPIEDVVKIIKKTNDNKTHTDVEGIVDTLLHIAHPNDLGAPTEQLETAIREALQSQADQYERQKKEIFEAIIKEERDRAVMILKSMLTNEGSSGEMYNEFKKKIYADRT